MLNNNDDMLVQLYAAEHCKLAAAEAMTIWSVDAGNDASGTALTEAFKSSNTIDNDDTLLFIVDPIDGAPHFHNDLPIYCVLSIGIVHFQSRQVNSGGISNSSLQQMTSPIQPFCNMKRSLYALGDNDLKSTIPHNYW